MTTGFRRRTLDGEGGHEDDEVVHRQIDDTPTGRSVSHNYAEGAADGPSGVQPGKTAPREGGAKRDGSRRDGGKREGGKREGAPKDSPRHEHVGPAPQDESTAEGGKPSGTERRRRRPGPKHGGKPELTVAGS